MCTSTLPTTLLVRVLSARNPRDFVSGCLVAQFLLIPCSRLTRPVSAGNKELWWKPSQDRLKLPSISPAQWFAVHRMEHSLLSRKFVVCAEGEVEVEAPSMKRCSPVQIVINYTCMYLDVILCQLHVCGTYCWHMTSEHHAFLLGSILGWIDDFPHMILRKALVLSVASAVNQPKLKQIFRCFVLYWHFKEHFLHFDKLIFWQESYLNRKETMLRAFLNERCGVVSYSTLSVSRENRKRSLDVVRSQIPPVCTGASQML